MRLTASQPSQNRREHEHCSYEPGTPRLRSGSSRSGDAVSLSSSKLFEKDHASDQFAQSKAQQWVLRVALALNATMFIVGKGQLLITQLPLLLEQRTAQNRLRRQSPPSGLSHSLAAQIVRHQDQARDDFGTILDELVFLIEQLARLPTRAEVRWIALRATLGTLAAIGAVALMPVREEFLDRRQ
jgi:hypothetical protein